MAAVYMVTAKSEEMCQMFKHRCCPDSAANEGLERTQQIDRRTALNTRITNFKVLQENSKTDTIFPQPTLIAIPRDKDFQRPFKALTRLFS